MQFTPICLFLVICSYSLTTAAPINQTNPDSLETKQQKATAIAGRLLKELAHEEQASHHHSEEQVKPALENQIDTEEDESDDADEEADLMPSMDDLYQIYNDRYTQLADEEESTSSETNDDEEMFPIDKQQMIKLMLEQDDSEEHSAPVIHTPIMDDSIMTAENHHEQ